MKDNQYKLERSELKSMTVEEADDHVTYWNDKTESERLNAACFIINQIFGVTPFEKVDFTYTYKRKHS
jgi:hypothetical protein